MIAKIIVAAILKKGDTSQKKSKRFSNRDLQKLHDGRALVCLRLETKERNVKFNLRTKSSRAFSIHERSKRRHSPALCSALSLSEAADEAKLGLGMETVMEGTGLPASLLFRTEGSVGCRFLWEGVERGVVKIEPPPVSLLDFLSATREKFKPGSVTSACPPRRRAAAGSETHSATNTST